MKAALASSQKLITLAQHPLGSSVGLDMAMNLGLYVEVSAPWPSLQGTTGKQLMGNRHSPDLIAKCVGSWHNSVEATGSRTLGQQRGGGDLVGNGSDQSRRLAVCGRRNCRFSTAAKAAP